MINCTSRNYHHSFWTHQSGVSGPLHVFQASRPWRIKTNAQQATHLSCLSEPPHHFQEDQTLPKSMNSLKPSPKSRDNCAAPDCMRAGQFQSHGRNRRPEVRASLQNRLTGFLMSAVVLFGLSPGSSAHNLDQLDTSIAFDKTTLDLMAVRAGLNQPLVQAGD